MQLHNKKRKPKIRTKNKQYDLKSSALYNISTKTKLEKLLFSKIGDLEAMVTEESYRVFEISQGEKKRVIQAPKFKLDVIQTRIASLLTRIETPNYLHSGIKGRSNITNAQAHIGEHTVLKMDIEQFYPSVSQQSIYIFFRNKMRAAPDVAAILARLCTYQSHIPTGSRLSMPISFWSNSRMFTEIQDICLSQNVTFTLFVDDLTFSGEKVNRYFAHRIRKVIERAGMVIRADKTKLYRKAQPKLITGVILDKQGLKVRNRHHKAIYTCFQELEGYENDLQLKKAQAQLLGRLSAAGQISKKYAQRAKNFSNSISHTCA